MKDLIKTSLRRLGIEITRYKPMRKEGNVVQLKPDGAQAGNVLLSYIIEPFFLKDGEPLSNAHTHYWESTQMARTFLDFGYAVDIIDYRDHVFVPQKDYAFFVGARTNFARIAQLINEDCVKIVHLDTSHWVFNNYATYRRTFEFKQRRGITITGSQRIIEQNKAIEYADYATILGNEVTMETYRYAQKPLYRIPVSTCAVYPWPEEKAFDACRQNFLWIGSGGLLHKGLDIVLEAFAGMPDHHVYVCGPIAEEEDFEKAFYKELYETPNIHTVGWVDVASAEFLGIMNNCIGLVYPSCAEGQAGSVVNCLHAGLIPLISHESGVDVGNEFGIILKDSSLSALRNAVRLISGRDAERLKSMSRLTWEFARAHHTRERFAEAFRNAVREISERHLKKVNIHHDVAELSEKALNV